MRWRFLRTAASRRAARMRASRSGALASSAVAGARRPQGAGGRARCLARRVDAGFRVLGPQRAAVAARRAATPRVIEGHQQNVNGVAFTPDGRALVTAGYDATLRISPLDGGRPLVATLPTRSTPWRSRPTARSSAPGPTARSTCCPPPASSRRRSKPGRRRSSRSPCPATASWLPPPASAARLPSSIAQRAQLERTLVGPGLPVWSVAFFPDGRTLLSGGTDRMLRRWDAVSGEPIGNVVMGAPEDPLAAFAGDPGADVFRACVACHTLRADEGPRAGPTLAGIFGRRIATPARLQFLGGAQAARHRLDAGDGLQAVRGRADGLHARHQDAGAADWLPRGSRRADEVPGEGDEVAASAVVTADDAVTPSP